MFLAKVFLQTSSVDHRKRFIADTQITSTTMNKKVVISVLVFLVLCVILGVLLGVLLPRRNSENANTLQELPESSPWFGNEEIRIFRQYLTYKTMPPDIEYGPCVEFLRQQATSLGLDFSVHYPVNEHHPVVVMTWIGSEPALSSIMLNSHMDVVPVFEEFWTHDPFAADVDEEGRIFARGSQDTKSTGTMILGAIRALKKDGVNQFRRTFHITIVPDEENGGYYGMASFVQTDAFRALNVFHVIDEALPTITNETIVINDERSMWRIEFIFHGITGHGSILFENTTGEKINYLINKLMEMRQVEYNKLKDLNFTSYANVTTINLTILKGGVQGNVIPPDLSATFDIRLAVNSDHDAFERQLNQWCEEAGGDYTINYLLKDPKAPVSPADETNPVWVALQNTARESGFQVVPGVISGGTDSRFLRRINIPGYGFSALLDTPILAHDHDEYVQADVYLNGIIIWKRLIANLGQISAVAENKFKTKHSV